VIVNIQTHEDANGKPPMVILVPLDGSQLARAAIGVGRAILSRVSGRLILFHAYWPGLPVDEADQAIESELEPLRALGIDVTLERRATPRDEETGRVIADAAEELGADLIVMTTHGRGGLGRWLFGSVTEQVIRSARVPLMMAPSELAVDWPGCNRASVLVALDGSDSAERALAPATRLARALRGEMILARILPDEGSPQDAAGSDEAKSYLLSISSKLGCNELRARTIVRRGDAGRAIAALAHERNVSVIAIGAPEKDSSRRCALGSAAMGIVRRSNVPILVA
jgi:nucleotide-binding universal stress UspA family protein